MTYGERRAAWLLSALLLASVLLNAQLAWRSAAFPGPAAEVPVSPIDRARPGGAAALADAGPHARRVPCPAAVPPRAASPPAAAPPAAAWAARMTSRTQERVQALAAHYAAAVAIADLTCADGCCTIHLTGEAASAAADELDTSAGFHGWAISSTLRMGPEGVAVTPCFDPAQAAPGPGFVDRLAERTQLLARAAPSIAACQGLPGAPGTLGLRLNIAPDGKDLFLERAGDVQGTTAAACVEDALLAAAAFAPASRWSVLHLTFHVAAK